MMRRLLKPANHLHHTEELNFSDYTIDHADVRTVPCQILLGATENRLLLRFHNSTSCKTAQGHSLRRLLFRILFRKVLNYFAAAFASFASLLFS